MPLILNECLTVPSRNKYLEGYSFSVIFPINPFYYFPFAFHGITRSIKGGPVLKTDGNFLAKYICNNDPSNISARAKLAQTRWVIFENITQAIFPNF